MISVRSFLVRGLLAGLVAGILAFGVAYAVGEPSIDAAIAIEESGSGHTHADEADPAAAEEPAGTEVPRSLQSTVGLLTATAVAGTTLGGLVGVLSALALGRFGSLGVRGSTLLVTGIGFVSLYVLPFVAYPPNPPAVGSADTIGTRTVLYLAAVAISVIAAVAAVVVGRRLADRVGAWWAGAGRDRRLPAGRPRRHRAAAHATTRCRRSSRPRCSTPSAPAASSPSSPCGLSSGSSWPSSRTAWCARRTAPRSRTPQLATMPS